MMYAVQVKRVYDAPEASDGWRVLVDRLWPRGVSKAAAHLSAWERQLAPSDEIRKAFGHEASRFQPFRQAYTRELSANPRAHEFARECARALRQENVTLLYGAKDETCNNAVVLLGWLIRNGPAKEDKEPGASGTP